MRWLLLTLTFVASAAESVNFDYAFGPPHRITVGRPGASEKTILDVEPGAVTMSWSYDDLRTIPLGVWKPPRIAWRIRIQPKIDGKPFGTSTWKRGEEYLPLLDNQYSHEFGSIRIEAIGAAGGAVVRVTAKNSGSEAHRFTVQCDVQGGWVTHNPAWIEPGQNPDTLLAMEYERPDRVLALAIGAEAYPVATKALTLEWYLRPGEVKQGWIVRPYSAYAAELGKLRSKSWDREFVAAVAEWQGLLARASRVTIPDEGVRNAFYASLSDLFIMREPLADGYVGTICGTEIYRSTNPFEPVLTAIALDQLGLHAEAADGLRVHLDMQEPSGEWADPKGWAHHMWGSSGMKAWGAFEHYQLTGDRSYLERLYPRLLKNSRWQEEQRAKTRVLHNGDRLVTYGLMPRGMGDGGLLNGSDYFGVFYPHNFMAVFADRIALQTAQILAKGADVPGLAHIHDTALADLRASLLRGVISEGGIQWIPGSPNQTSGSRWGALWPLFPTGMMAPMDPLITGTIAKIEQTLSAGGHPLHAGWMEDGIWAAITLDNLSEAHLARDNGDAASRYLDATLNHASPLYTWCEERGAEQGSKKTSGDRQHLWTPLAVVRFVRDSLVMEQGTTLHLARGTARSWLEQGKSIGIKSATTHFGTLSYRMTSDVDHGVVHVELDPPGREAPNEIVIHVRHPQAANIRRVTVNQREWTAFNSEKSTIQFKSDGKPVRIEVFF